MDGFRHSLYSFELRDLTSKYEGRRRTLCMISDDGFDVNVEQENASTGPYETQHSSEDDQDVAPPYEPRHSFDEDVKDGLLAGRQMSFQRESHESDQQQRRCLHNLMIHSLSVMLINVPYMTLQHLKVNLLTQAGGFMALLVSCFIAPLVVQFLGYKRTMVVSFGMHILFVLANLVPQLSVVFPTFVLLGLANGPFWTAQGCYVSLLASEYAQHARTDLRTTTCGFFGLFFTFYHFSKVLGRPLAYFVLDKGFLRNYINSTNNQENVRDETHMNLTGYSKCGGYFCPREPYPTEIPSHAYSKSAITIFTVIYLVLCVVALLLKQLLVDDKVPVRGVPTMTLCEVLRSTVYMHCKETMIFLLPLFAYVGFEQLFIYKDYLAAFVRCSIGFRSVGPTIFAVSLTETGATLVIGFLQRYPKCRFSLMELGSLINLLLLVIAKTTDTDRWTTAHFYIFAICWAVCDAIWQTSTCAMVSVLFPHCRGPAFATLRLWQSLAVGAGFSLNKYTCVSTQLSWYIALLVFATLAYTVMERRFKKRSALPFINLYTPVEPGNDHVTLYLERLLNSR